MTLRVLIVTYYFPPIGGGGVQRVLAWCRYLADHDIDVTVLAPDEPRWVDEDATLVVPAQVHMVRTPDPSPDALIPREQLASARGLGRALTWMRLQPRRLAVPDIHRGWRSPAVRAARAAHAEAVAATGSAPWDAILSTSPPETTHLVAHELAGTFGVPWVADLRDSWLDLPHLRMDSTVVRLKHAANVRLATRVFRRAAALTTVSEPLAADLRRRHPDRRIEVLPNGVDLDDVSRARARRDGFRERGRFVVLYTGNFFGRQSPRSFLAAVERAVERDPTAADDLVVRFIGGMKPADQDRIDTSPALRSVVERIDFLRHDDVLAQQAAADLLLLYVAPGRGSAGVVTGKLFEYLASRRPVLALVPPEGTAANWLREAGAGHVSCPPDAVDDVADELVRALQAWRDAGRTQVPDLDLAPSVLTRIDRRAQVGAMARLLRQVTATSPTPAP